MSNVEDLRDVVARLQGKLAKLGEHYASTEEAIATAERELAAAEAAGEGDESVEAQAGHASGKGKASL